MDAPVANDLGVHEFSVEDLEFPLTPEVNDEDDNLL